MAWNELLDKRGRGTKVFQDSVDPAKHSLDSQAGTAWHYKSDPDVDSYDTEVDLTPQRVLAGGHDGWRVVNNGWHYFLGQPNGLADGFVGFGGRQGDRWLLFRLLRVGYLHWPTRAWDDIGGSPDYDRANLSQQTNETTINTTGETIPVEAVATWSDLWNTPGGGALDASWRIDGNRLKEEITINDAARTWIAANRPPSTPAGETYFSFVFRLGSAPDVNNIQMDLSYLPRWLKNGILQDTEGDFDDDDGTEGIEVQNALQEFLFFLPIDEAYVDVLVGDETERHSIKLRKRIYKDGSDYYLLVGAKVSDLVTLPAGDLVFDPTVDYQVGASADDATEASNQGMYLTLTDANVDNPNEYHGLRWLVVTIPSGATIDSAYVDCKLDSSALDEPNHTVDFEDSSTPATFTTTSGNISSRSGTTASVTYGDGSDIKASANDWLTEVGGGEQIVVTTIIAELQASYDYSSGLAMVCRIEGTSADGSDDFSIYYYDNASADAAKLHIEYTAAAAGTEVEVPVGALEITGYAPTVTVTENVDIEVPVASLTLTGYAPTVETPVDITVPLGTLTITGYAPTVAVTANVDIEIPAGTLALTGYAPTVAVTENVDIEVPVASLTLTGYAPTVETPVDITVPLGTLTLTGYAPTVTVTENVNVDVPVASLTLTGYAPTVTVTANVDITVPVGSLVLTGYAPTVTVSGAVNIDVPVGTLVLTGYAPTVTVTENIEIEVPTGTLVLTGYAPVVGVGVTVDVPLGTLVLTGFAPTVTTTANVAVEVPVGSLVLTGYAPEITAIGADFIGKGPPKRKPRRDLPRRDIELPEKRESLASRQARESLRSREERIRLQAEVEEKERAEEGYRTQVAEMMQRQDQERMRQREIHAKRMLSLEKAKAAKQEKADRQKAINKTRAKNLKKARKAKAKKRKK